MMINILVLLTLSCLTKVSGQIANLLFEKSKQTNPQSINIHEVMAYVKYFLEHMQDLLIHGEDAIEKATLFGLLFDSAPTYAELHSGTPKMADIINLNRSFMLSPGNLAEEVARRWNPLWENIKSIFTTQKSFGYIYSDGQIIKVEDKEDYV